MTSITADELLDQLEDVLARVRNGEQFMIVDDGAAVAGLLPVADLRASVPDTPRSVAGTSTDGARERPGRPAAKPTSDQAELERLREELERD